MSSSAVEHDQRHREPTRLERARLGAQVAPWRRRTTAVAAAAAAIAALALLAGCGSSGSTNSSGSAAGSNKYGTLKSGVIKVAIEPYMPYTALQGGKLVGLDSDILNAAAQKLGLKVETQVTDFAGMLAGVQSRRVDITIGGVAWSADRQKQGLFTDPPYYSPPAMAVHGTTTYPNVASLQGKSLGTVTGYVWVKSIQQVPGAQLHSYPNANGVFSDLGAGRINVGFLDPLLIIYEQKQRPDLPLKTEYLQPPSTADVKQHPAYQYFQPYMTGFYLPKQETKLERAISQQIDAMYKNGALAKLVAKWGGDPKKFLVPSPGMAAERRGVDRAKNWSPPSISG
jgi:ABC-type amino acid transport substrate-binding protein